MFEKKAFVISTELSARALPPLLQDGTDWVRCKAQLVKLLGENLYGFVDEEFRDLPMEVTLDGIDREHTCAGKVETRLYRLQLSMPDGSTHSVPFTLHLPKREKCPPVILHIAFRSTYPDRYMPVEEITDRGYALLHFNYQHATPDTKHGFDGGLAAYFQSAERKGDDPGNVSIWAYTASRIMDWLQQQDFIDPDCVSVCGHSRLGKTALWCSAQDSRFFCVYCNEGGYGGSGLIRGKTGEDVADFLKQGSWTFFCENFKKWDGVPASELPFDQHFAIAASAPRYVYVASAEDDHCMDYVSDFLSCAAASEVWKKRFRLDGLEDTVDAPVPGETALSGGRIGYHVRKGIHFFGREDWNRFMDFLDKKRREREGFRKAIGFTDAEFRSGKAIAQTLHKLIRPALFRGFTPDENMKKYIDVTCQMLDRLSAQDAPDRAQLDTAIYNTMLLLCNLPDKPGVTAVSLKSDTLNFEYASARLSELSGLVGNLLNQASNAMKGFRFALSVPKREDTPVTHEEMRFVTEEFMRVEEDNLRYEENV